MCNWTPHVRCSAVYPAASLLLALGLALAAWLALGSLVATPAAASAASPEMQTAPGLEPRRPVAQQPATPATVGFEIVAFGDGSADADHILLADMDGDGDLDAVLGNSGGPSKIFLNRYGRLDSVAAWESASGQGVIAAGDANGDGALDLIVDTTIYLNRGIDEHGRFGFQRALTLAGEAPTALAWGDLDGDGLLDLFVANRDRASHIYRNESTGDTIRFTRVWSLPSPTSGFAPIYSAVLADVDGNGGLDLAVGADASACAEGDTACGHNQIYINRGWDGTAGALQMDLAWTAPMTDSTRALAWGDLNQDGRPDLAVGNAQRSMFILQGQECLGGLDRVFVNNGLDASGTLLLDLAWTADNCEPTTGVAWIDADSDGDEDLSVLTDDSVLLYRNERAALGALETLADRIYASASDLTWGDVNSDGVPDLAVASGVVGQVQRLLLNRAIPLPTLAKSLAGLHKSTAIAWGDVDHDGDLDLAVGDEEEPAVVYANDGMQDGQLSLREIWRSASAGPVRSVAWGDANGDGHLDLALGASTGARVYLNGGLDSAGGLVLSPAWAAPPPSEIVAWGDVDGDGDLDLAVGSGATVEGAPALYLNQTPSDGRSLDFTLGWQAADQTQAAALAWADMDGDGDLDLAVGNFSQPSQVFANIGPTTEGGVHFVNVWTAPNADGTYSVAWGDMNRDGRPDLAEGNARDNKVYLNSAQGLQRVPTWISPDTQETHSVAWGDMDGDGDLDLAAGNRRSLQIYPNDQGRLATDLGRIWRTRFIATIYAVAWADVDRDGDPDLTTGADSSITLRYPDLSTLSWQELFRLDMRRLEYREFTVKSGIPNYLYANLSQDMSSIVNAPPRIAVSTPAGGASAALYGSASVLTGTVIPITFELSDRESDPVAWVEGFYSMDGGGSWYRAHPVAITDTLNLATSPSGVEHRFLWDTFASGLYGWSDNVVVRLDAHEAAPVTGIVPPGAVRYPNSAGGAHLGPPTWSTTNPFRVQGTQVRVVNGQGEPIMGAYVLRLGAGKLSGAEPLPDPYSPFTTNAQGVLPGKGQLALGDQLVALLPLSSTQFVTFTHQVRYFLTSAEPISTGLAMSTVEKPGVTELVILTGTTEAIHPLLLFDLSIAAEWDFSQDEIFLAQLQNSVRSASELLYDVTNGQAAIGRVNVFPAKTFWHRVDLTLYAANDVHPSAAIGGIVEYPLPEVVRPSFSAPPSRPIPNAYQPGQIRMGPAWDPFGEETSDLGEQWWRTLAHELAHHIFFLPDNYIGLKLDPLQRDGERRFLGRIDCRNSFMTTTRDPQYSEFLGAQEWVGDCASSLAAYTTGRTDWATIEAFYPLLRAPDAALEGPAILPLNVTHVVPWQLTRARVPLPTRNFDIRESSAAGTRLRLPNAQVYLFQAQGTADPTDDVLISLGSPVGGGDHIKVRGAYSGDRLCLYDFSDLQATYAGCIEWLSESDVAIPVTAYRTSAGQPRWAPRIDVTAITTRTLAITVTQTLAGTPPLDVQIFPTHYPAFPGAAVTATLPYTNGAYTTQISLPYPASDLFVHLRESGRPGHETISRFSLQLPWQAGELVTAVPDYPMIPGTDFFELIDASGLRFVLPYTVAAFPGRPQPLDAVTPAAIAGFGDRPMLGAGDRPMLGGGDRPILGSGDRPMLGGGDRPMLGGGDRPMLGGGDRPMLGGGDRPMLGAGDRPMLGGAQRHEFAAPAISSDAQVVIYVEGGLFEPNGIRSVQMLPTPPELDDEPWLTPVGRTYAVELEPGSQAPRAITFNYLQRDVPEGYEHTLAIYFLPQYGAQWQRLETRQFVENLVIARLQPTSGAYAVMSTVALPTLQPGWNLLAYPLPDARPVDQALQSISGVYGPVIAMGDQQPFTTTMATAQGYLLVRARPSLESAPIGYLSPRQNVTAVATDVTGKWLQIECPPGLASAAACWITGSPELVTIGDRVTAAGRTPVPAAGAAPPPNLPMATSLSFGNVYWIWIEGDAPVTPYLAPPRRTAAGDVPGANQ
ncbi:MAG: VCBS repeat-containing protein [Caldilineaceae bacterium]|nr:VCBS repeat-containing protein [Caldilineaceae bacterium]